MHTHSFPRGNILLISGTPTLLRAAAAGDLALVKALLAQGADPDGTTAGGQTALMLASISGLAEVVRLLLDAGADVRIKDRLGLTAMEWSKRRGFSELTEVLANSTKVSAQATVLERRIPSVSSPDASAKPEIVAASSEETKGPASEEEGTGEADTPRPDQVARIQALFDQLGVAEESRTSAENGIKVEQERRKIEEERTANEKAQARSRLETQRIAEETRKRVEEEVRKTRSRETRIITRDIWPSQPVSPLALAETITEPAAAAPVKRCPKCGSTFKGESCTNCTDDALALISAADFSSSNTNIFARPTVWMLMTITLSGGVFIGYQLNDYVSKREEEAPSATAAPPLEPPVSVKPAVTPEETSNLPLVSGELKGAEANIPEPEYPVTAKSEGVAGAITVRVRVNNRGRVILARSSTGDWRLRAAAVQAAKKATFLPEKLAADQKFVTGTITYTFKP